MRALLLAPALSLALVAAHFARAGAWPIALAFAGLVALLLLRRTWVPRLVQLALAVGVLEWSWTAIVLVQQRIALGRPWGRLALILGAVAFATAASALVFRHSGVRRRFGPR
jgi:hypothetical protein